MQRGILCLCSALLAIACAADDEMLDGADAARLGTPDATPPGTPDATPPSFACAPTATTGHQEIDCPDGVHMDVEVSAACATGGCGLIVDVHGYTMNADQLDQHTRMRTLAPPLGYVVVQPSAPGIPSSWGTGEHDDVVWAFVEATMATLAIDPDRVHFMGFSQGSMLSFRMLCAHAEVIASIAPDSGGDCFASGAPAVVRPILYVQGTKDTILPWAIHGPPQRDAILAAYGLAAGDAEPVASGDGYSASRWSNATGVVFEFWQHDLAADQLLGGHCLSVPMGAGLFKCVPSEFDYAAEALRFFKAHPR